MNQRYSVCNLKKIKIKKKAKITIKLNWIYFRNKKSAHIAGPTELFHGIILRSSAGGNLLFFQSANHCYKWLFGSQQQQPAIFFNLSILDGMV